MRFFDNSICYYGYGIIVWTHNTIQSMYNWNVDLNFWKISFVFRSLKFMSFSVCLWVLFILCMESKTYNWGWIFVMVGSED